MVNRTFHITAGFMPLTDAAILLVAKDKGFAEQEGIALTLVKESNWATIRDRTAIGHFDVAHMLAPLPIAATLGLSPIPMDVVIPMTMGLGGNAITLAQPIADTLKQKGPISLSDPMATGQALAQYIAERHQKGQDPLRIAVVHPHSGHNYELRYWLAASGINPDRDVNIVIVPPPLLPDTLAHGKIDGFCAGEPWSSVTVAQKTGEIVATKSAIWPHSPEKVLAVSRDLLEKYPDELSGLLRAIHAASHWCAQSDNYDELAHLLAREKRLNCAVSDLLPAITGSFRINHRESGVIKDFLIPFGQNATYPQHNHLLWLYSQMVRWGHIHWDPSHLDMIRSIVRPDLFERAISASSAPQNLHDATQNVPFADAVTLFDGKVFTPDDIPGYLSLLKKQTHILA